MGQALAKKKANRARRPGRGRQVPVTLPPPQGNVGPDTTKGSQQMFNAEIIPIHSKSEDWRMKRRLHTLEWMVRPKGSDGKRKRPEITPRQRNAGMEYWARYAETQRGGGPAWNKVYVDASPKPGDVDVKRLEAMRVFRALEAVIPAHALLLARFVCCFDRPLSEWTTDDEQRARALDDLTEALDALADELRL